jgi:hypothetical protein
MFAAEAKGELPKGTARRWAHHTKDIKSLPDKVEESTKESQMKEPEEPEEAETKYQDLPARKKFQAKDVKKYEKGDQFKKRQKKQLDAVKEACARLSNRPSSAKVSYLGDLIAFSKQAQENKAFIKAASMVRSEKEAILLMKLAQSRGMEKEAWAPILATAATWGARALPYLGRAAGWVGNTAKSLTGVGSVAPGATSPTTWRGWAGNQAMNIGGQAATGMAANSLMGAFSGPQQQQ